MKTVSFTSSFLSKLWETKWKNVTLEAILNLSLYQMFSWKCNNILLCLKLISMIPCQKMWGVNSRKNVLDGPDFDISSILDCAMAISFAAFRIYIIIYYLICSNHFSILFLLESWYMKSLKSLFSCNQNRSYETFTSWIFQWFLSFYTHDNGPACSIMCLSDSLTKKRV